MPKLCHNYMEITGEIQPIKSLIEKEKEFKFSSFLPEPVSGLYNLQFNCSQWRTDHWGTTTNPSVLNLKTYIRIIMIRFYTEFSPAIKFAKNLVKRYPNIAIYLEFNNSGMGFLGQLTTGSNSPSSLHIEDDDKPTKEYKFVYTPIEEE